VDSWGFCGLARALYLPGQLFATARESHVLTVLSVDRPVWVAAAALVKWLLHLLDFRAIRKDRSFEFLLFETIECLLEAQPNAGHKL
jgi:hypothetical protein